MNPFLASDKALIEKLENIASTTNENVLSDEEIARGRVLLSTAQATLLESESQDVTTTGPQSGCSLTEHISKLSAALAPHKCLHPEILERIFCSFDYTHSLKLPPVTTQHPWVLGQVCSRWRHLSRSIPDIWKAEIAFVHAFPVSDTETPLKQLRCAVEILPDIAYISLSVADVEIIPMKALIPYIPHVSQLEWIVGADQDLIPPAAFSRLKSLHVTHWYVTPETKGAYTVETSRSYAGLFGETSQLENLTLRSNTPSFLLSDIPWSQLQSFCLEPRNGYMASMIYLSWMDFGFGHHNPFRWMSSLKSLTLDMRAADEYFPIMLSFSFPWQQLTSLTVYRKHQQHDLSQLIKTLQKCTSLVNFDFFISENPPYHSDHVELNPALLPSLEVLRLGGIPFSMIRSLVASGFLLSLEMGSVSLQDFYIIAEQCPRLTYLLSHISGCEQISTDARNVTLSQLTTLSISFSHASLFPTKLVTPLLTLLTIHCSHGSNLFEMTADFIINSDIRLQGFVCRCHEKTSLHSPAQSLREVLSRLDLCSLVIITWPILPQDVLDDFASGCLLPFVDELAISASDPDVYLSAIQRRLEREAESGVVCLRDIRGYLPDVNDERLKSNLKELEVKYGVKFKVLPIWR